MITITFILALLLCAAAMAGGLRGVQDELPGNLLMLLLPGIIGVLVAIGALLYSVGMRGDYYPFILFILAASVFAGNVCALWQGKKSKNKK